MHQTCKRCGAEGLMWGKRAGAWRLYELDQSRFEEMKRLNRIITKLHECSNVTNK